MITLFTLIALLPPWRYLDGRYAGIGPIWAPPDPLPAEEVTDEVAMEYVPIKIIPMAMSEREYQTDFTEEERRLPFIDIRRMLTLGTIVFLLGVIGLIVFDDRTKKIIHPHRQDEHGRVVLDE